MAVKREFGMADVGSAPNVISQDTNDSSDRVTLPSGYRPSADEPFMNDLQLAYFRRKLIEWKENILKEARETLATLQNESLREPDVTDRASNETDWSIELRTRSEEHTSELQSLMRISSADFCWKKKNKIINTPRQSAIKTAEP